MGNRFGIKTLFGANGRVGDGEGLQGSTGVRDTTVLVVDDSRTMVHALRTFLEQHGYHTIAALDGVQALAAAKWQRPDLILMDIVMPNMNGFEATRALSRNPDTREIPVVIVSGSERVTDRVWGMRLGAKGYLAKPIRKSVLLSTVAAVLAESRRTRSEAAAMRAYPAAARERRVLSVATA